MGKEGLIAEHPQLHEHQAGDVRRYVSAEMLNELKLLRRQHFKSMKGEEVNVGDEEAGSATEGQFESYRDPLDPQPNEIWLCSAQPAFVTRGSGTPLDTGWTVLVEERRQAVVAPLRRLWRSLVYGGLVAIALVVLILTALWIYVLCHLNEERGTRPFLRRLMGMAESLRSSGSLSLGTAGTARSTQTKVSESHG